jgi:hypothetical protein
METSRRREEASEIESNATSYIINRNRETDGFCDQSFQTLAGEARNESVSQAKFSASQANFWLRKRNEEPSNRHGQLRRCVLFEAKPDSPKRLLSVEFLVEAPAAS